MSDTLLVSTRKGLFWVRRQNGNWGIDRVDFPGDNVTLTLTDPRSGYRYAALDHGHFGVKLHRLEGANWREIAVPIYPPKPKASKKMTFGAVHSPGVWHAFGRYKRAVRTSRA
jgi:hypothetical protein